jgi:predicted MFS family arabinose efflux permease
VSPADGGGSELPPVDGRLIALLAVACGFTVANVYYVQPLLAGIATAFGVSEAAAGLLVTATQVFYAVALVLIVPLGDIVDRRKLTAWLLLLCCAALVTVAAAPGIAVLAVGLGITAAASVVAQVLIPFAGTLAPARERGYVLGLVMSGALSGVLVARTASGLLASVAGWRAPFAVAALAMALLAGALWRALPEVPAPPPIRYRRLLGSVATLVRAEPALRRRMVYGACGYAGFALVWTTLTFLLSAAPFDYGEGTIGLFGLAGLAGAVGARGFGRLTDRGLGPQATGAVLGLILASWGLLALGRTSVPLILLALVLLDFGIQGQNILSQGVIYSLGPEIAGRVTTAYVTATFAGGAIGSAAGSLAWGAGGWLPVCAAGATFAAIAAAFWLLESLRQPSDAGEKALSPPAGESA